jgi:fructokinase
MTDLRIGIDLGGTKTEVAVLDAAGALLFRHRQPTPQNDYAATLAGIVELVKLAEQAVQHPNLPVGVGIPGTISTHTQCVKNANSTWLNGQPMPDDLARMLGRPVPIQNDANCLALSEATDGAGAGSAVVLAVILGTGCGAGVVTHGHVLAGANGVAGEWGHNPMPWTATEDLQQRPCFCGQRGCVERFISGTGLQQSYQLAGGDALQVPELMTRYRAGEPLAERVWANFLDQLARALAQVIHILDPDVIVLGGGVSQVAEIYQQAPPALVQWVLGGECQTPIVPAQHGDSSGVRGAAWLN